MLERHRRHSLQMQASHGPTYWTLYFTAAHFATYHPRTSSSSRAPNFPPMHTLSYKLLVAPKHPKSFEKASRTQSLAPAHNLQRIFRIKSRQEGFANMANTTATVAPPRPAYAQSLPERAHFPSASHPTGFPPRAQRHSTSLALRRGRLPTYPTFNARSTSSRNYPSTTYPSFHTLVSSS